MIPDPLLNDISELPEPLPHPVKLDLGGLSFAPIPDEETAIKAADEVVAYFERQKRWKPVKTQSLKAFAVARFHTDAGTHLSVNACKAIAHALGVFVYADRRTRAMNAAQLEVDAETRGYKSTTAEVARRVGLSPRALRYLRTTYGYQVSLASSRWQMSILIEMGLLESGRRTDVLADFIASPALRFIADPEQSAEAAASMLRALKRQSGADVPLKHRTIAYDLVVSYFIVSQPLPQHVLKALAAALHLLDLRYRIPFAGK